MKFFATAALLLPAMAWALPQPIANEQGLDVRSYELDARDYELDARAPELDDELDDELDRRAESTVADTTSTDKTSTGKTSTDKTSFDKGDLILKLLREKKITIEDVHEDYEKYEKEEKDAKKDAKKDDKKTEKTDKKKDDKTTTTTTTSTGLEKRGKVPGLHCGFKRAFKCLEHAAGTINGCVWAAIHKGKDAQDDSSCVAAVIAIGSLLPADCALCLKGHL
ncbi:Hypothetical predicted protein [Lecanosticta acicola]|uniref:Uncharacterized protein n=1 Tax=Lecanosticta acicola TaxID=111012 RepID=A0AAI8W0W8_9PEZI|nr:Hypothetical predicted protein [Lecanosticta acicola]